MGDRSRHWLDLLPAELVRSVALFIDSQPLHRWRDNTRTPPREIWSVAVFAIPAASGNAPQPSIQPQRWSIDTGFSGEAFAWRHHLAQANLDPDDDQGPPIPLRWSVTGRKVQVPVRIADLWLVPNRPGTEDPDLTAAPLRLELDPGIAFKDQRVKTPDPEFHRALIGMRAILRGKLKVEIDFNQKTVSISAP